MFQQFGDLNDTADFVGEYVKDIKNVIVATAMSGVHLWLEGEPGCGKTHIATIIARRIYGDTFKFVRCDPTVEPEELKGTPMFDQFEHGVFKRNPDDTLYDPKHKFIVLDELPRLSDPGMDIVMRVLDRNEMPVGFAPVAVATANWTPRDKRFAATLDRFGLFLKVTPDVISWKDIALAMVKAKGRDKEIGGGIPDKTTIDTVKQEVNNLSDKAGRAVSEFCGEFAEMMQNGLQDDNGNVIRRFHASYRRVEIMTSVIASMSVYYTGTNDFDDVPATAKKTLAFCYVTQDEDEYRDWRKFVTMGTTDPIEALVDNLFRGVRNQIAQLDMATDARDQLKRAQIFAVAITKMRDDMRSGLVSAGVQNFEQHPAYVDATTKIEQAFSNVIQGQPAF